MTVLLMVGGALFWMLVALVVVRRAFRRIVRIPAVRTWLDGPGMYPYASWIRFRSRGYVWRTLRGLRLIGKRAIAPEVVTAHCETNLAKMQALRDVMVELDGLPTVQQGKQALGIQSVFELAHRPAYRVASPYSHPLQYPPYYIPGVPARMFYEPEEFEWSRPLVEAYPMILSELRQVLAADGKGFKAYVSEENRRLAGWNTFNFFFYGKKVEENCAQCPGTTAVLESLPRFERDHIMFSALNPGAHIPAHVGPINGIVRAHLGLAVPEGCYIKVGDQQRTWRQGELLLFDDSFLHEVWNHSNEVRIVLFMNFWHPCFRPEEIPVLERYRAAYEHSPFSRVHQDNQAKPREHDLAPVVAHA